MEEFKSLLTQNPGDKFPDIFNERDLSTNITYKQLKDNFMKMAEGIEGEERCFALSLMVWVIRKNSKIGIPEKIENMWIDSLKECNNKEFKLKIKYLLEIPKKLPHIWLIAFKDMYRYLFEVNYTKIHPKYFERIINSYEEIPLTGYLLDYILEAIDKDNTKIMLVKDKLLKVKDHWASRCNCLHNFILMSKVVDNEFLRENFKKRCFDFMVTYDDEVKEQNIDFFRKLFPVESIDNIWEVSMDNFEDMIDFLTPTSKNFSKFSGEKQKMVLEKKKFYMWVDLLKDGYDDILLEYMQEKVRDDFLFVDNFSSNIYRNILEIPNKMKRDRVILLMRKILIRNIPDKLEKREDKITLIKSYFFESIESGRREIFIPWNYFVLMDNGVYAELRRDKEYLVKNNVVDILIGNKRKIIHTQKWEFFVPNKRFNLRYDLDNIDESQKFTAFMQNCLFDKKITDIEYFVENACKLEKDNRVIVFMDFMQHYLENQESILQRIIDTMKDKYNVNKYRLLLDKTRAIKKSDEEIRQMRKRKRDGEDVYDMLFENPIYECGICCINYTHNSEFMTKNVPCGHIFCKSCMNLLPNNKCPTCRAEVVNLCKNLTLPKKF